MKRLWKKGFRGSASSSYAPLGDDRLMDIMTVGLESKFHEAWGWIQDRDVGAVGIYGIGGVGKTTLLQKIKMELLKRNNDNVDVQVVWVQVSRFPNFKLIQEDMYNQLVMPHKLHRNRYDNNKVAELQRYLSGKKFVLLLDDVWDWLDLSKLGIPLLFKENVSKVVFTTRSEAVCSSMGANRCMKLDGLGGDKALQLFQAYVGQGTIYAHPGIQQLSKLVAEECKGLPLALITVGQAMATKRKKEEWEHALQRLRRDPSKFSGMEDRVFRSLKLSYERLNDDMHRSCFLYCSIFPKDQIIRKDELIELWIREGLLGEVDDILDAREVGERFVRKLKNSGLLEIGGGASGNDIHVGENYVSMHPLIREMALWIDSKYGERSSRTLVLDHVELLEHHMFQEKDKVERLTLWGTSYKELPVLGLPAFPNLKTLLVRCTDLAGFPASFIQHMRDSDMTILDLSGNHKLTEVPPGVGDLINLLHLNLSETSITSLPNEVRNLKKLRSLLLDETHDLTLIPIKLISGLQLLEVFSKVQYKRNIHFDEGALLEELELLKDLVDAGVMITSRNSLDKFLSSNSLVCCTRRLSLNDIAELSSLRIPHEQLRKMNNLETLEICRCVFNWMVFSPIGGTTPGSSPTIQPINLGYFPGLRNLKLWDCPGELDFRWIIYLPNLQLLSLAGCELVYEIVPDVLIRSTVIGDNRNVFPNLTTLILNDMANLSSISLQPLPFLLLKELYVHKCPRLRRLPFGRNDASSLDEIRGTETWWNELRWDDEAVRGAFSLKFHPIDDTTSVIFREGGASFYQSFDNPADTSPRTPPASPISGPSDHHQDANNVIVREGDLSSYQSSHKSGETFSVTPPARPCQELPDHDLSATTSSQNACSYPIYPSRTASDVATVSNQELEAILEQADDYYEIALPDQSIRTGGVRAEVEDDCNDSDEFLEASQQFPPDHEYCLFSDRREWDLRKAIT